MLHVQSLKMIPRISIEAIGLQSIFYTQCTCMHVGKAANCTCADFKGDLPAEKIVRNLYYSLGARVNEIGISGRPGLCQS